MAVPYRDYGDKKKVLISCGVSSSILEKYGHSRGSLMHKFPWNAQLDFQSNDLQVTSISESKFLAREMPSKSGMIWLTLSNWSVLPMSWGALRWPGRAVICPL